MGFRAFLFYPLGTSYPILTGSEKGESHMAE